jgi:hypothetical protein
MFKKFIYIFLALFAVSASVAQAQRDTLTQEVEVTKTFKPTISDANKLNSMPTIEETQHQKPTFNYNINSKPVFSTFSVNPLKAATIETAKKTTDNGYGLVRVGLGSYYKPYGEVFFNNANSNNSLFGIHAMHLSSFGNIKLEGGDKVDAPFMKNEIELFVKQMFHNSLLSVNLNFNHDGFNYYGYPLDAVPDILLEEDQTINYFGTKQAFSKGSFNINLKNPTAEMDEEAYGFNFDYHFFGTKTEQREHFARFSADLRKPLQTGMGLLDAGIQFTSADKITPRSDSIVSNKRETWLYAKPAWYIGNETANLKMGLNTWFIFETDENSQAKITPNIRANWAPVKEIINIYAGIDGDYKSNHFSKIAYENPFINPDHDIKNSFEKIRFYGGFDGKLSNKTNFKVSAEYSKIDDQTFYYLNQTYYLDTELVTDNTFAVLYDNMNRLKLNAEVFHASSDKLDFMTSVNYYSYKLNEQTEAWNMPNWDATFSIGYKVNEQLSLSANLFLMGQRTALIIEEGAPGFSLGNLPTYKSNNLDAAFDLNVKGNYQITSKFSVFAQLNNFGFQKYQQWFGYPVQSFNFLAGVSYAF